jgi:flagellar protein FlaI
MATGHGGLSTMHAESLDTAIKRLTSPPMNIAPSFIPMMNCVIYVERVMVRHLELFNFPARRVRYVWEVVDFDNYQLIGEWDPREDRFKSYLKESALLKRLGTRLVKTVDELLTEIERRRIVLEWMVRREITKPEDVNRVVLQFYEKPDAVLAQAVAELETLVSMEKEQNGPSALLEVLQSLGGSSDLRTLMQTSRLDSKTFWDSVTWLQKNGYVEIEPDGTIKLKMRVA